MSTLGDPLPPPLSTFVNFWRPPPPAPWVDVNKVRSLTCCSLAQSAPPQAGYRASLGLPVVDL